MLPARVRTAAVLLTLAALGGCGEVVAADGTPPVATYDGPLTGKDAAAKALQCEGEVYVRRGGLPTYEDIAGASSPEGAIANWPADAHPFGAPIARDGYELVVRKGNRALLTYTYEGRVRSVAIAVDEANPRTPVTGWAVLDAAWCDPSEFPAELDGNHWMQIWSDRDGERVDTRTIHGGAGSAHCNWESMTYVTVGGRERAYIRDPEGVISPGSLRGTYRPRVKLPAAAEDTGYRRGEMELFLTDAAAYVRYPDHVEAWPRAKKHWGCR